MRVRTAGLYLAALALAAFLIGPFAWMVSTAVKSRDEIFTTPPTWWPHAPSWDGFAAAASTDVLASFGNSALVCVGTTALCMVLALLACYPLSRTRVRWRGGVLGAILVSQLLPHAVLLLPIYRTARELGMLNTRWGLVVAMLRSHCPSASGCCTATSPPCRCRWRRPRGSTGSASSPPTGA